MPPTIRVVRLGQFIKGMPVSPSVKYTSATVIPEFSKARPKSSELLIRNVTVSVKAVVPSNAELPAYSKVGRREAVLSLFT